MGDGASLPTTSATHAPRRKKNGGGAGGRRPHTHTPISFPPEVPGKVVSEACIVSVPSLYGLTNQVFISTLCGDFNLPNSGPNCVLSHGAIQQHSDCEMGKTSLFSL